LWNFRAVIPPATKVGSPVAAIGSPVAAVGSPVTAVGSLTRFGTPIEVGSPIAVGPPLAAVGSPIIAVGSLVAVGSPIAVGPPIAFGSPIAVGHPVTEVGLRNLLLSYVALDIWRNFYIKSVLFYVWYLDRNNIAK